MCAVILTFNVHTVHTKVLLYPSYSFYFLNDQITQVFTEKTSGNTHLG